MVGGCEPVLLAVKARRYQRRGDEVARRVAPRLQVPAHAPLHLRIAQRFDANAYEPLLAFRKIVDGSRMNAQLLAGLGAGSSEHAASVPARAVFPALARAQLSNRRRAHDPASDSLNAERPKSKVSAARISAQN